MATTRIGIIGSGDVGKTLGSGLAGLGHPVKLGTREPGKLASWVTEAGANASVGSTSEAAAFGEVVILATRWSGTESAIADATPANLAGKVVIDATNPLLFAANAPPRLALGHTDSGGEQVQRWLPAARVVKAFNTVGHAHMVSPTFPGGPPDMFICGNDAAAKVTVSGLCRELGWPTIDVGGIDGSRQLEPLCILWVGYGLRTGSWNHAFKLLRR